MTESIVLLAALGLFYMASQKKYAEPVIAVDRVPIQAPYTDVVFPDRYFEELIRDKESSIGATIGPKGIPVIQYSAPGGKQKYLLRSVNSLYI